MQEWPEFMRPIQTPPASKSPLTIQQNQQQINNHQSSPKAASRLLPLGSAACITYNRVSWLLRVRKEVFSPAEPIGPPSALHLVFCQIVADVYGVTACLRINQNDKRAGMTMLSGYGVTSDNLNSPHRANIKRNVVELARTWPLYFARLFPVSGAAQVSKFIVLFCFVYLQHYHLFQLSEVQLLAVSHWGIHLVKREANNLHVIKSFALTELDACTAPRPTSVSIEGPQGRITLHTPRAQQLSEMVTRFCSENRKVRVFLSLRNSH